MKLFYADNLAVSMELVRFRPIVSAFAVIVFVVLEGAMGYSDDANCKGTCDDLVGYFCDSFTGVCELCSRHCRPGDGSDCTQACDKWKGGEVSTPKENTPTFTQIDYLVKNLSTPSPPPSVLTETNSRHRMPTGDDSVVTELLPYLLGSFLAGLVFLFLGYACWYRGGFRRLRKRLDQWRNNGAAAEPDAHYLGEIVIDQNLPREGPQAELKKEDDCLLEGTHPDFRKHNNTRGTPLHKGQRQPRRMAQQNEPLQSVQETSFGAAEPITSVDYCSDPEDLRDSNPKDSGFESCRGAVGGEAVSQQKEGCRSGIGLLLSHEPEKPIKKRSSDSQALRLQMGPAPNIETERHQGAIPTTPLPTLNQDGTHEGHEIAVGTSKFFCNTSLGGTHTYTASGD